MLGSFAAPRARDTQPLLCHHTAIYSWCSNIAEDPGCRAMGVSLFAVMFFMLFCTGAS